MNKDVTFVGESWAKPIIEFGLRRGFTREQLAEPDTVIDVGKAFADHYGITLKQYAEWANESIIENYGVTVAELHEEMVRLSRKGMALRVRKQPK
jgi:hypothetical protein